MHPMTCFLDMDGVLADYYGGVCRAFGFEPWPFICTPGEWNFFTGSPMNLTNEIVAPVMDATFYANLDRLPDATRIVEEAERWYGDDVYFLTAPWDTPGCFDGKMEWVRRHFPKYRKKVLVGSPKVACAHRGSILIDDSPVNIAAFRASKHGGEAVLFPRPWNAKHHLADHQTGAALLDAWFW